MDLLVRGAASEPAPAAPPSGMIFRPRPRVLAGGGEMSKLLPNDWPRDAKTPTGKAGGDDRRSRGERAALEEPQPAGLRGDPPHHGQRDDIHEAFLTLACAIICWRRPLPEPLALLEPLRRQRLLSAGYQSAGHDYQRLRMCP